MTTTTTLAHTSASGINSLRTSGHATPNHGSRSNTPVRIKRVLQAQLDVISATAVADFDVADAADRSVRRSCSAHALDSTHAHHLSGNGRRRRLSVTTFNESSETPALSCRESSSSILGDVLARRQLADASLQQQQSSPAENAPSSSFVLTAQMGLGEYVVLGPDACVALASSQVADPVVQCLVVTAPGATHILTKEEVERLVRYSHDPQNDTLGSSLAGVSPAPTLYQSASLGAAAGLLLERPDSRFAAVVEESGGGAFLGIVSRADLARALLGDRSCVYSTPPSAVTSPTGVCGGAVAAAISSAGSATRAGLACGGKCEASAGGAANGPDHPRPDLLNYQGPQAAGQGSSVSAPPTRIPLPPPPLPPPLQPLHRQISASRQAVLAALGPAPSVGPTTAAAGPAAAMAAAAAAVAAAVSSSPQMMADAAARVCSFGSARAAEAGPLPELQAVSGSGPHQLHAAPHRLSRTGDPYPRASEAPPLGEAQQQHQQPEQLAARAPMQDSELESGAVPQLQHSSGGAGPQVQVGLDHPTVVADSLRSFSDPIRSGWDMLDNVDDALDVLGMVGKSVNAEAVGRKLLGDVIGAAANIAGGSSGTGWIFKYLYDGDCSICRTFQAMLEKMDNGVGRVMFVDISQNFNPLEHGGINYRAAMETLHILSANGQVFKGVTAVIKLLAAVDPEIASKLGVVTAVLPLLSLGYMVVSKNRHHLSKVWAHVLRTTKVDQALFGRDILGPDFGARKAGFGSGSGSRFGSEADGGPEFGQGPAGMAGSSLRPAEVRAGPRGSLHSHQLLQTQPSN